MDNVIHGSSDPSQAILDVLLNLTPSFFFSRLFFLVLFLVRVGDWGCLAYLARKQGPLGMSPGELKGYHLMVDGVSTGAADGSSC